MLLHTYEVETGVHPISANAFRQGFLAQIAQRLPIARATMHDLEGRYPVVRVRDLFSRVCIIEICEA
jgi:hypothetical protein